MRLTCRLPNLKMYLHNHSNPLIFTYHSISSNFHVGLNSVHPNRFSEYVEFIENLNNPTVENNHIKIAFDDGYESARETHLMPPFQYSDICLFGV